MPLDTTYNDESTDLTNPLKAEKKAESNDKEGKKAAEDWKDKIKQAGRFEEHWRGEARRCKNVFLNRNPHETANSTMFGPTLNTITRGSSRRPQANIFYSNVCFSRSSILTKMPEIIIRQRYSKQNSEDEQQKQSYAIIADIVQRSAEVLIGTGFNEKELMKWKDDVLITGRGVLWVIFDSEENPNNPGEAINEVIKLKRIGLSDFRISPARNGMRSVG